MNNDFTMKHYLSELTSIKTEIKRNNDTNKALRSRCVELEEEIAKYMDVNKKEVCTYNNTHVSIYNSKTHQHKKKKDKDDEIIRLLKNNGVHNSDNVYKQIQEMGKGEEVYSKKIRINKKKDKT